MSELHVVLGATGGSGLAVVNELVSRGKPVRAVSRTGRGEPLRGVEYVKADALSGEGLQAACRGASVIYNCINVPYYDWHTQMQPITGHVIDAAPASGSGASAKIIFLDNLYAYGQVTGPMTEQTPRKAPGAKGRLRIALEERLLEVHRSGKVRVAIGRASDFFGVKANSTQMILVTDRLRKGSTALWLGRLDMPHTYNYLPDVGWGLVTLAENDASLGEIWHLPAADPLTGRQFIEAICEELHRPARMRALPGFVVRLAGLVSPLMREVVEVMYQFERPWLMDASKFTKAFGSRITPHRDAIRATLAALQQHS